MTSIRAWWQSRLCKPCRAFIVHWPTHLKTSRHIYWTHQPPPPKPNPDLDNFPFKASKTMQIPGKPQNRREQ